MEYAEYGFAASDGLDETSSASLTDPISTLRTLEYILRKPSTSSISWEVTLRFPLVVRSKYVYVRELPIANRDSVTLLDIVYYEHAPCLEGCRRVIFVPFEPWTLRARMPLYGGVSACISRLNHIRRGTSPLRGVMEMSIFRMVMILQSAGFLFLFGTSRGYNE